MSTLSVLLCNYNHAKTLPRAIDSIMSQSRVPEEFILLDDGSTDNSLSVIDEYVSKYPLIKLVKNPHNMGLMRSFSKVLSMAQGDFVYPASADDYILPGFFEKAMGLLEKHPGAGLAAGQVIVQVGLRRSVMDGDPIAGSPGYLSPEEFLKYFNKHLLSVPISASLLRRDEFIAIGGLRSDLGPVSDFFAFRAIAMKRGGCYIPEPLAVLVHAPAGFGGSFYADENKRTKIIDALVSTMRSEEFKPLFPSDYVNRLEFMLRETWHRTYGDDSERIAVAYNLPEVSKAFVALASWRSPVMMVAALYIRFMIWLARVLRQGT